MDIDINNSYYHSLGFKMETISGLWYTAATSEPTIPSFCKACSRLNFTINEENYFYDSLVHCSEGIYI